MQVHVQVRPTCLDAFPAEVLGRIVLAHVDGTLHGPPTDLNSLLRVSKSVYNKISIKNYPSLYSSIFSKTFDGPPAVRRLGETCHHAQNRASELVKRFLCLKRFRYMPCRTFSAAPTAREDLWLAYLLFLENDQYNYEQLVHYARVDKFALNFINDGGPFHDGADRNGGWKIDNENNALVAWLFWFTDKGNVTLSPRLPKLGTLIESFRKSNKRDT
jgi:hypothetical protein